MEIYNVFKLHTYETQIITALIENKNAKAVSDYIFKYTYYCMQCGLHPIVSITNELSIELYNSINKLIYSIKYQIIES